MIETEEEIIKSWKENNVDRIEFEFSCGGDCMNDTSILIYDKEDNLISNTELVDYFDDQVYHNVEFYEASDGHYIGESGTVTINLDDTTFTYCKVSESEWCETTDEEIIVDLTNEEKEYMNFYVSNFNGSSDEGPFFNYRADFVMTSEKIEIEERIVSKIHSKLDSHESVCEKYGEATDWYTYECNVQNDKGLENNQLILDYNHEYYIYKDE